jgi:flagellar hook assembly protein FlgD
MLVNANYEAGDHSVRWDGKNMAGITVSSGVYLYQLQVDDFSQVKKMCLLR